MRLAVNGTPRTYDGDPAQPLLEIPVTRLTPLVVRRQGELTDPRQFQNLGGPRP